MREILFRGKRKDNNKWIYGYLSYPDAINVKIEDTSVGFISFDEFEIISETVGQYVGYDTENKIFEGDILKSANGKLWIIKWLHQSWYVSNYEILNSGRNKFAGNEVYTFHEYFKMLSESKTNISIVGNIHDNPELLQSL